MLYPLLALAALAGAPSQGPDSAARARYAPALRALDDSIGTLNAAAERFQTDLPGASPDLVVSRSTRMRERCRGTLHAVTGLDSLAAATSLHHALTSLRAELSRCNDDFAPGQWTERADSLRAWAPHRLARLAEEIQRYRAAKRRFEQETAPRK